MLTNTTIPHIPTQQVHPHNLSNTTGENKVVPQLPLLPLLVLSGVHRRVHGVQLIVSLINCNDCKHHHAHTHVQEHGDGNGTAHQHGHNAVDAQSSHHRSIGRPPHELVADDRQQIERAHGAGNEVQKHLQQDPLPINQQASENLQRDGNRAGGEGGGDDGGRELALRSRGESHGDDVCENGHQRDVEIGSVHVLARREEGVRAVVIHLRDALPGLGAKGEQQQLYVKRVHTKPTRSFATT